MMNNINYEDDYLEPIDFDKKHEVSKRTLKTLEKVMFAQDDYGFNKYKKALKSNMNYDWLQMFLEEMADGLKYIQNEIDRRNAVIQLLEWSLKNDSDSRFSIETALRLLKMEGTGK
jgi:DNA polymerase sigma